jgi:transposase
MRPAGSLDDRPRLATGLIEAVEAGVAVGMEDAGEGLQMGDRPLALAVGRIIAICREDHASRRLATLPGVGPIIATALVASIDDGRHFRSGRELAAWIGLVPRQHTTGGKPRLAGIGRRANHYLRRQMIHGARSAAIRLLGRDDVRAEWLKALVARRGFNRAVVALANKTARIAWALLQRQEVYRAA